MLKQKPRRQINQQKKIDKKVALVRGIEINEIICFYHLSR